MNNKLKICAVLGFVVLLVSGIIAAHIIHESKESKNLNPNVFLQGSDIDEVKPSQYLTKTAQMYYKSSINTSSPIIDISQIRSIIDELNVEVYKINNKSQTDAINDYLRQMDEEGYNIVFFESKAITGLTITALAGQKGIYGRGLIFASGELVQTFFNCNLLIGTSHGVISSYFKLLEGESRAI